MSKSVDKTDLNEIHVDKHLIHELSAHGLISSRAREYALSLLYPEHHWGLWVSRLLLVVGISLFFAGIITFFAFNWTALTPLMKMGSVQILLLASLCASYYYGISHLAGKLFLLIATVLVGVFLVVFSQVYQTGADAYTLFFMWAALTVVWALIGDFAPLWVVWIAILNTGLYLFLTTHVLGVPGMWWLSRVKSSFAFSYLAVLNAFFLVIREYLAIKKIAWVQSPWTRFVLILSVVSFLFWPTFMIVIGEYKLKDLSMHEIVVGPLLYTVMTIALFVVYRYTLRDVVACAVILLSACVMLDCLIGRLFFNYGGVLTHAFFALLMAAITVGLFTGLVMILRDMTQKLKGQHD